MRRTPRDRPRLARRARSLRGFLPTFQPLEARQLMDGAPPATPAGLVARAGNGADIFLAWSPSPGATVYEVERSFDGVAGWTPVGTPGSTALDDQGLAASTTYHYRVSAIDGDGESPESTPVAATTSAFFATLGDAGFEAISLGTGYGGYAYNPTGSAWTFAGDAGVSGAGVAGNGSGMTAYNPDAPQGVQVGFVQRTGALSQTVADWGAGPHRIHFSAAQRDFAYTTTQDFEVRVDDISVGRFHPTGGTYQDFWTPTFVVDAGPHKISFAGLNTEGGDDTVLIDDVAVRPGAAPPVTPMGLTATPSGLGTIAVRWSASGASGYRVERSLDGVTGWTPVGPPTSATSMSDAGLAPVTEYFYRVHATSPYGDSPVSATARTRTWTTAGVGAANPGFEVLPLGPGGLAYRPTGTGWDFAGDSGLGSNGAGVSAAAPTPDGSQFAFVQRTGSFSQTIPGWAAGTYALTFTAARRSYFGEQTFSVLVDGQVVGTFAPATSSFIPCETGTFAVAAGTHTITFQGLGTAGGDDVTALIDAVAIVKASPRTPGTLSVGDFDFEAVDQVGFYTPNPIGSPWTFVGTAGLASDGSPISAIGPTADGSQFAYVQGTGSFSQSIAGWEAGSYSISFDAARRSSYGNQDFRVLVDGVEVGTFAPAASSFRPYSTGTFAVAAGTHTIAFQSLNSAGGENTALIDAVSILNETSTPTPSPRIVAPASVSGSSDNVRSKGLSVVASIDGDASKLVYTWFVTSKPEGAFTPKLSDNHSITASNTIATFSSAGVYKFLVEVWYRDSFSTSEVQVDVEQSIASIKIHTTNPFLNNSNYQLITAKGYDQFQSVLSNQPNFLWNIESGIGTISQTGYFRGPDTGSGKGMVRASVGDISATTTLMVVAPTYHPRFNFSSLPQGTIVSNQFPLATFTGDPSFPVRTNSQHNLSDTIGAPADGSNGWRYTKPIYIDFSFPVDNLEFSYGNDLDSYPNNATLFQVNVFVKSSFLVSINVHMTWNGGVVYLGDYRDVTRIEIIPQTAIPIAFHTFYFTPKTELTAHRTGDNQGQVISDEIEDGGDPSRYVILTDTYYIQSDGTPAFASDSADLPNQSDGSGNNDLAKVTLGRIRSTLTTGKLKIVLSSPKSVRLFKSDGTLLYEEGKTGAGVLQLDFSNPNGYLDEVQTGDLEIWVEGVHKDPNFTFAIYYEDEEGKIIASDKIHLTIAEWTFRDTEGQVLDTITPIWEQEFIDGIRGPNALPWNHSPTNTIFKNFVEGLPSGLFGQVHVKSSIDPTDNYSDDLVTRNDGAASSKFQAVYSPIDFYSLRNLSPITTVQRDAILTLMGINLVGGPSAISSLVLGQAGNPKDKFTRVLSIPGDLPITLNDADGIYNSASTVTVTVSAPPARPGDNWKAYAELSDGRIVNGIRSGGSSNTYTITFPVTNLVKHLEGGILGSATNFLTANIVISNKILFNPYSGSNVELDYENSKSLTIAVIPAGKSLSNWQVQAWQALQVNGVVTGDPIQRNEQITRSYVSMFNSNPTAFEWAGLASFASYAAGDGMKTAEFYRFASGVVVKNFGINLLQLRDYLGQGNISIFSDMYPQLLAYQAGGYQNGGLANIIGMFNRGDITQKQLDAWTHIDDGLKANDSTLLWQGQKDLAMVEQYETLQAVLDLDETMWKLASNQNIYSPMPGDTSKFQDGDVSLPGASFANKYTRFSWFNKKMVPAFKAWRMTNSIIDVDELLKGNYK